MSSPLHNFRHGIEESSIFRSRAPESMPWADPSPLELVIQVLTATGASVEEVHLLNLPNDILYALIQVRHPNTLHALKTRVSHALALAVRLDAPIRVADAVLAAFGIPHPIEAGEHGQPSDVFSRHLWHLLPPAPLIADVAGLPKSPQNLAFQEGKRGWQQGEQWTFTLDPAHQRTDQASAALHSGEGESKGWLLQGFLADAYREKRMRFAGWIKTQEVQSAGLVLTIEGVQRSLYQANKRLQGTHEWTFCEIPVVVPADSFVMTLRVVAIGHGTLWMDGLQFTEAPEPPWPTQPQNLDFAQGLQGWEISDTIDKLRGSLPQDYEGGLDQQVTRQAPTSAFVLGTQRARGGAGQDHLAGAEGSALKQVILAEAYRGKQVRLWCTLKTEAVVGRAGLFLRAGSQDEMLLSEDMHDRPLSGTQAWRQEAITLTIPRESVYLLFGVVLYGSGQMWVEDLHLEVVHDKGALPSSR